jgi:non-canonical purine NTP pyrophosphatase, rdgB/HAM1 family
MKITLITSNPNKAKEIREIFSRYGIELIVKDLDIPEIQSEDLKEIVLNYIREAYKIIKDRIIVEDSGLFIKALKGFPGPYSSYVFKTTGNEGILKLMNGIEDRTAEFVSIIGYKDEKNEKIFEGRTKGRISFTINGKGWGFDPIFIPEGYSKTYGEMSIEEKNQVSHRGKAIKKFLEWFLNS